MPIVKPIGTICLECGGEYIVQRGSHSLSGHIKNTHGHYYYYHKYLFEEGEDKCEQCGEDVEFGANKRFGYPRFCSQTCVASFHNKQKWENEDYRKKRVAELVYYSQNQSDETRAKLSKAACERNLDPNDNFGEVVAKNGKRRKRKFNNIPVNDKELGIRFRSKFEHRAARRLEKAGIKWQFEPRVNLPGGSYCLPDFYLPEYEIFVELRPSKMIDNKLISKIWAIKHTYKKEVVLCTNIQGVATLISRLDEHKPKLNESTVWIFEDKRGEEKQLREIRS